MSERFQSDEEKTLKKKGAYNKVQTLEFIPSGCTLLDCVLGGGWALGRIANIVGDKSTGKTLLAIEAAVNFATKFPKGKIWYREAEAAFDVDYAESLGLPTKRIDFGDKGIGTHWSTIEDIFEDLEVQLEKVEKEKVEGGLYIVDSLDALTSRAALKRDVDKGSFGLEKPKIMGQLFNQLVRRLKDAKMCVIFVSQVRDRIGVMFGDKHTRSGGKALDFYASQVLWLTQLGTISRTIGGVKRPTAIQIKAKAKKNKVGQPFRDCEFLIRFGFGVDDFTANMEWLETIGRLRELELTDKTVGAFMTATDKMPDDEYKKRLEGVQGTVKQVWADVEKDFLPVRKKYS